MADVVSYKGLTVVDNASGDGGEALTADLKLLADRIEADTGELASHVGDTGNPHSVTAAQAGAPTTAEFTGHTGDTGNPHGVTAAQAGAPTTGAFNTHTADSTNPHVVTAAQVGNGTAQWNADKLQGNAISSSSPLEDQHLVYSVANGWQPETLDISYDASPTLGGSLTVPGALTVAGADSAELGFLAGVTSAVQTQLDSMSLKDGTRAFTGVVGGVTPTTTAHLTTKGYVDSLVQGLDWQDSVIDELTTPPGGESTGDRYLIIATASGAWAGREDDIAEYNGSGWDYTSPSEGMAVWIEDINKQKTYNGSAWVLFGSTVDHGSLTGLGDDDHTQYLKNVSEDASPTLGGSLVVPGALTVAGADSAELGHLVGVTSSINTHMTSTSNPHGVTATQVDNDSALWNAAWIRDGWITTGTADTGDILRYNGSTWVHDTHLSNTFNPHSVTYTQAGAAAAAHTHVEADVTDLGSYIENVVEDTTPQLGGNLDVLTRKIYTSTTNGDIIIEPNGLGNIAVRATGNARGAYAMEFQKLGSDTQVAAGTNCCIIGGQYNSLNSSNGVAWGNTNYIGSYSPGCFCGGSNNTIDAHSSTHTNNSIIAAGKVNRIGDSTTTTASSYNVIGGGNSNIIVGQRMCVLAGGYLNNIISSERAVISGGSNHTIISGTYSTVCGGNNNDISSTNAVIAGGTANTITGTYGVISGGYSSDLNPGQYGVISGGQDNLIETHNWGTIGGGRENSIKGTSGQYAVICGGRGHTVGTTGSYNNYGLIGGGYFNNCIGIGQYNSVLNGQYNVISSTLHSNTILSGRANVTSAGAYSVTAGYDNDVTATVGYCFNHGYRNSSEIDYTHTFGLYGRAFHCGSGNVLSRSRFAATGDNQTMVWTMSRHYASTGFIQLFNDHNAAWGDGVPKLEDGDTMALRILVIGVRDASPWTYAAFEGTFCIQRQGIYSAVTVNGAGSSVAANVIYRPAATWDCQVTPSHDGSTYGRVAIDVKGPNNDIRWQGRVEATLVNAKST